MKLPTAILASAALATIASPIAANERAAAPVEGESELAGTSLIVLAAGVAAILLGIFVILDDEEDAMPLSP